MDATQVADSLSTEAYNQARLHPSLADPLFLHFTDLLIALSSYATNEPLAILDYGCGGSPYRSLFPNSDYRRADYVSVPDLDYLLTETGGVAEKDASFDLIISTQVLEHLKAPAVYLAECARLLKPGGRLICTTHGFFQEHGCPYDFQRWTPTGLARDLELAGLKVNRLAKLSTGPRGLVVMLNCFIGTLRPEKGITSCAVAKIIRALWWRKISFLNRWAHTRLASHAVRDTISEALHSGESLYIGILAEAQRE